MFAARASLIIAICLNVLSGLLLGFSASSSVALTAPFDGQVRVQVFSTVEKPAGFGEVEALSAKYHVRAGKQIISGSEEGSTVTQLSYSSQQLSQPASPYAFDGARYEQIITSDPQADGGWWVLSGADNDIKALIGELTTQGFQITVNQGSLDFSQIFVDDPSYAFSIIITLVAVFLASLIYVNAATSRRAIQKLLGARTGADFTRFVVTSGILSVLFGTAFFIIYVLVQRNVNHATLLDPVFLRFDVQTLRFLLPTVGLGWLASICGYISYQAWTKNLYPLLKGARPYKPMSVIAIAAFGVVLTVSFQTVSSTFANAHSIQETIRRHGVWKNLENGYSLTPNPFASAKTHASYGEKIRAMMASFPERGITPVMSATNMNPDDVGSRAVVYISPSYLDKYPLKGIRVDAASVSNPSALTILASNLTERERQHVTNEIKQRAEWADRIFWEYEQIPTHKALEVNYREISSGEEALVFEQDVRYVKDPIFVVFPFEAMSFDELDLYMGNGEVLFFGDKAALAQAPHDFGLDVLDYKVREPAADALTLLNERMAALHQLIFKLSVYAILLVFVSLVFGVCNVLARRQQLSVQHLIGYGPKDKHGRLLAFLGMFSGGVLLMHFAFQGKIDGIFTAFMRLFISEPLDIVDVIYLLQTVLAILSYGVLIATLLIAEKRLRLTSKRL